MNRLVAKRPSRIRFDTSTRWFFAFGYIFIGFLALACLLLRKPDILLRVTQYS